MEKYHSCNISHCAMFQLKIGLLINSKSRFNNNNYSVKKVLIRCRQRQICNSYILGPSYFCEIWALYVSGITYGHFWPLIYLSIYLSIFLSILLSIDLSISIYIIFIYIYIYLYKYISAQLSVCFFWLLQQMKLLWSPMKYINLLIITEINSEAWNILAGFNPYVVLWSSHSKFRFPCMTLIKLKSLCHF